MKVVVSFVRRPPALWPLAVLLWALAAIVIGRGASLAASGYQARREQAQLSDHLVRLEERLAGTNPARLPEAGEFEALRLRVRDLNALSGLKGWSTPQLLAWLEQRMPKGVYLVALHHTPRDGELALVAQARSAGLLRQFLRDLEGEPSFGEVLLSRQATSAAGAATLIQFEIKVRLGK